MQIAVLCFLFYSRTLERPFSFFFFCCIYFYLCSFDKRELKGEENDLQLMKKDIPLYCNVNFLMLL